MPLPLRARSDQDFINLIPTVAVWEITLACDLKCLHCGSRAGKKRPSELSTQECLEVVAGLAELKVRELSLIGGEAYLRPDVDQIIAAATNLGIRCVMQTGARNLNDTRILRFKKAGLTGIGVSLDGMRQLHDCLRGVEGSFDFAVDAIKRISNAGLSVSVNSQIGAKTAQDLPAMQQLFIELGVKQWQIQLTVAMGNAVDNDELLLQPYQLLEIIPLLADMYRKGLEHNLLMIMGNNIGYFGPYEHLWRGFGNDSIHWTGCAAGHNTLGLEADGAVKGCPSLESEAFTGGNIREHRLAEIWRDSAELRFGRLRTVDQLWGFCRSCYYADNCRAGCTWTGHSLFKTSGNNPYCHYRALELDHLGLRERIVKLQDAPKRAFAIGEFETIIETVGSGQRISEQQAVARYLQRTGHAPVESLTANVDSNGRGRIPDRLRLCRSCKAYVKPQETACPHCHADLELAERAYAVEVSEREQLIARMESLLYRKGRHEDELSAAHDG